MNAIFSFESLSLMKRLAFLVVFPVILTLIFGLFSINSINDNRHTLNNIAERTDRLILDQKSVTPQQRDYLESLNVEIQTTSDATSLNEKIIIAVLFINILVLALLGYIVYRSISTQIHTLISTIYRLNRGDKKARADISGQHELAQLGLALNQLLDERDTTEQNIVTENENLNDSVFDLLESVAELSERNLTVRATIAEDVTGPVADAINRLAVDTSDVLKRVRNIAISVELTSQTVDRHTRTVKELAASEQVGAKQTSTEITTLIHHLDDIATASISANQMADETTLTTEYAHQSVSKTLESMTEIRETVQETGKRIKRLGERSQEITHIVDLINAITERTTVLAINASMQALSAGEAGKGFSVIAEEIQRLSESSHESTDQITYLIKNIQHEARTTMDTMERTIAQVVSGSSLAEKASEQMQLTLDASHNLSESVKSIAKASKQQRHISQSLQIRANEILKSTQSTGEEMQLLGGLTKNMADNARSLVHSVKVFQLE